MWILAIDTSGSYYSIAVSDGNSLSESVGGARSSHSESLAIEVGSVLKNAGIGLESVGKIVIGRGPGSFTGLRIGYSFVRGLSYAKMIPISEYSSLEAMVLGENAFEGGQKHEHLFSLRKAGRGEYFFCRFGVDSKGDFTVREGPKIVDLDKIKATLVEIGGRGAPDPAKIAWFSDDVEELDGISVKIVLPTRLAYGLLQIERRESSKDESLLEQKVFCKDWQNPKLLGPDYQREVAAKTISERRVDNRVLT